MSDGERRGRTGKDEEPVAAATSPAITSTVPTATFRVLPRLSPSCPVLFPIAHPPDPIARVVGDQQGAVRRDDEPDRAPQARAVGQLPAGDEVLDRRRPPALPTDAHDFTPPRQHWAP